MNTNNLLKSLSSLAILVLLVFLCFAFAASTREKTRKLNIIKTIQVENPAKTFCIENSCKYLVITKGDGSQFGICNFEDGSSCKADEFLIQRCRKGSFATESNDFGIMEILEESCEKTSTCKVPRKYLARSDCAYQANCLKGKCTVVCPSKQPLVDTDSCENNPYDLNCACKEGKKQQVACPENMTCPAVVQFECIK